MGFSMGHLIVVLLIVILLFGTKKVKDIGSDLGDAIKNFRRSMSDGEKETNPPSENAAAVTQVTQDNKGHIIEGQVTSKQTSQI
jgi:sec-independent protein translocase protein TatA